MTQGDATSSEPTYPYPPRYWWLKRLVLLGLLVVIGIACLRVWWGRVAARELDRAVAELRARGEPVWAEDFAPPDLPDDQNAAVLLRGAMDALDRNAPPPSATNMTYHDYPPYPRRWHRVADSAMRANAAALDLARRARAMPQVNWQVPVARPAINTLLPHLNQARALANLLGDAAVHAHLAGDDAEAVERCRDLLALARAVQPQPFIVSHLVSRGIAALAHHRIELIAADLHIDLGGAANPAPRTGAKPAQVRALIYELLALDDPADLVQAFQSERMTAADTIGWFTAGNPMLRPMFQLDQARAMRGQRDTLVAATQPTPKAAAAFLAAQSARPRGGLRLASALSEFVTPAIARVVHTEWRIRMETRLAAAALGARLYHAEHGRWPESVETLVPAYLPAIPLDPWGDGVAIKIALIPQGLPDGSPRPVVYSVGEDGQDDTARGVAPPPEPQFGYQSNVPDQWRDLVRWIPPAAATRVAEGDAGADSEADDDAAATQPSR